MSETPKPEPNPKGMGSIFLRGRTYWIQYSVNGRRERETTKSENQADAVRMLKDRLGKIGRGEPVGTAISRTTLADLKNISLIKYAVNGAQSLKNAEEAWRRLERFFKLHQKAAIITSDVLMGYVADGKARELAPATIERDLAILRHAFRLGQDAKKIGIVPKFPVIKYDNVRPGFFTYADYQALLAELPDYLKPLLTVAYVCGWRVKSELLTRKVRHVDLKAGTLTLEKGETKNRKARTYVFKGLPEVEAAITALVQSAMPTTPEGITALRPDPDAYLFRRPNGKPIRVFRDAWAAACKRAGIRHYVHDLRRSAVRNMVRAGIAEAVCMKVSGHLTRQVFERYNIVSTEDLQDAAVRLAAYHADQQRAIAPIPTQNALVTATAGEKSR